MADLAQDFFKRDLSDSEWAQLGRQLASQDAVADRFLDEAAGYHASLGLPEPVPPKGGFGGAGGGLLGGQTGLLLGVLLGAAIGGAAVWFLRAPDPAASPQVPPAASANSAATSGPVPAAGEGPAPKPATRADGEGPHAPVGPARHPAPTPLSQPSLSPAPSSPPPAEIARAREASPGFPGLAAVVELKRQGLVTARVLNAAGEEQRLLFAGVLEAGRWSFGWDGLDLAGRHVAPGTYTIEVQEGSRVLRKQVAVSARRGSAP